MLRSLAMTRFAPEIEGQFQASYYDRVRPTLRLVSGVLAATLAVYLLLGLHRVNPFIGVFSTLTWAFACCCLD